MLAAAAWLAAGVSAQTPAAAAHAPDPAAFQDPDNAALLYFKVWLQKQYIELKQPCSDQLQADQPAWRPDAALQKTLVEQQGVIAQLIRATKRPSVDFGLEYSQGIGLLLSHPQELRASARILACDSRRCLALGDADGACERVAAIYRLARHGTHDRVLISSLVAIAVNSLANHEMRAVIAAGGGLSTAGRDALLAEARKLSEPDGFGVKRGVEGERWWTSGWLRSLAGGPDAGAKIAEQLRPLIDPSMNKAAIEALPRLTPAQIIASLDLIDGYYQQVVAAWDLPDAQQRIANMEQQVKSGTFGDLAAMLAPAFSRAFSADAKARAEHAAALRQLEAVRPVR